MVRYHLADIRPMFLAIKEGNIKAVKKYLTAGTNVNAEIMIELTF